MVVKYIEMSEYLISILKTRDDTKKSLYFWNQYGWINQNQLIFW